MDFDERPMEALDYVKAWMRVQDSVVGEGHYPESTACRRQPKSGRAKDSTARCWRCDAESLVRS